jgi:hypothetical protein
VEPCKQWLCQGDLFEEIPIVITESGFVEPNPRMIYGPALLITYDCQLDKRTAKNNPQITRMQFIPIRNLDDLLKPDQVKNGLREGKLDPPEAIYIEPAFIKNEGFGLLGEAYTLPATYFGIEIREIGADQSTDGDRMRAHATQFESRICTMSPAELELLKKKMTAFWTGLKAEIL